MQFFTRPSLLSEAFCSLSFRLAHLQLLLKNTVLLYHGLNVVFLKVMALRHISSQRLSVGRQPLKQKECYDLFCQFFELFLYQTGQFPDFMLIRKTKSEYATLRSNKVSYSFCSFLSAMFRTFIRKRLRSFWILCTKCGQK